MNSFFTLHSFLEVGKTQDLPSKFWQTLGDALFVLNIKNSPKMRTVTPKYWLRIPPIIGRIETSIQY
jgi:hypothetical protein